MLLGFVVNRPRNRLLALALLAAIGCASHAFGGVVPITISTPTNWSSITSGTGTGGQPGPSDNILVAGAGLNGLLIVDVTNGECASIQLGKNGTGAGKLLFTAGSQITVGGTVALGDLVSGAAGGTLSMNAGGTLICQGLVAGVTSTFNPTAGTVVFTIDNTVPSVFGTFFNLSAAGGTTTLQDNTTAINGTLNVDATIDIVGGTTTIGSMMVTSNGTIQFDSGLSDPTVTFTGGVTINGNWKDFTTAFTPDFQDGLTVDPSTGFFVVFGSGMYGFSTNPQLFSGSVLIPNAAINGAGVELINTGNMSIGTLTLNANTTLINNGGMTVIDMNGTGSFTQGAGWLLTVNGHLNNSVVFDPSAVGNTVSFGGDNTPAVTYFNLHITGSPTLDSGSATVNGFLTIDSGATFTVPASVINHVFGITTIDGALLQTDGSQITFDNTVTVDSGGTIQWDTMPAGDGNIANFNASVTINAGGTWQDNTGSEGGPLFSPIFFGDLTVFGFFTASDGAYTFDFSSSPPNIQTFTGSAAIPNIVLGDAETSMTFVNNGTLSIPASIVGNPIGQTFVQGAGATLNIGGTFDVSDIFLDASAANNTVNYNGNTVPQTVVGAQYDNLTISTSGVGVTLDNTSPIQVSGTLDASQAFGVTYTTASSTVQFNGTAAQQLKGGGSNTFEVYILDMGTSPGVTLGGDVIIDHLLQFGSGNLTTGSHVVRMGVGATSSGATASSHINGKEQAAFSLAANQSFTFDIGNATQLAKIAIANFSPGTAGDILAVTTNGNHPNIATGGIDPTKTAARFWGLTALNGISGTFDATFNFNASEVTIGNPNNFIVQVFNGAIWSTETVGTKTATSTQATGVDCAALGAFQLGEVRPPVPVITSALAVTAVGGVPFSYTITATNNPTAFSAHGLPQGLTVNPANGVISGTPMVGGTFNVALSASNAGGLNVGTATLVLTVQTGPPVLNSGGVTITGNAVAGGQITFSASATDPNGLTLTYSWDFGDGSTAIGATVQHVYATGATFTVTLTVSNPLSSATVQIPLTILTPAGDGLPNIGQGDPPIVNILNGISISIAFSDGGIIGLSINVDSLTRDAFSVSTDMAGTSGSIGTRTGTSPVFQFAQPGVFVATSSATNTATNAVAGNARKTIAVSNKEVGLTVKYINDPKNPKIKTGGIKGKFAFPKSNAASAGSVDAVTYSGSFEIPEGLDITSKPTFAFAIGNIIDSTTIDAKGNGARPTATGVLKKVQVKYPKAAKGSTTPNVIPAGQTATFTVQISGVGLSAKGFGTDGITGTLLPTEKSTQGVPRSIQVAMVFAGAAYEATASVNLTVSKKGDSGAIGTRK